MKRDTMFDYQLTCSSKHRLIKSHSKKICHVISFLVMACATLLIVGLFAGSAWCDVSVAQAANQQSLSAAEIAGSSVPLTKLNAAYNSGKITLEEQVILELKYIYDHPSFPAEYRLSSAVNAPVKCGYGVSKTLHEIYGEMSPENQALATSLLARPSMQKSLVTPGGHFRLHFDTLGEESVIIDDLDSSGEPDFIEIAALYLDSSWDFYHTTVGYLEPPSDGIQGGDSLYDVYFLAIFGFGSTRFENPGPEPWDDFTSFILLHNTFLGFPPNQDPDGDQLGALKVTCAHEYFHAVQLAYDGNDDLWFYESGATAQEDILFLQSHDNYQYFPFYWNSPDTFLTVNPGFHKYGAYVWPLFLSKSHSDSLMRTFWEYSRFSQGMKSFDSAFAQYGTSTAEQFQDFALWSFFTGSRFQPGYFVDGANYPGFPITQSLPQIPFSNVAPDHPPDGLGANYLALPTQNGPTGLLTLNFSGSNTVLWRMNVYLKDSLGGYESLKFAPVGGLLNNDMTFMKYNYTDWDTIFISPVVVSPFLDDNNYTISASVLPHGDADTSGGVNIADVTFLIAYIFSQGPAPAIELLLGDSDCSGRINIGDVTFLIAHIFAGGPAPCAQ